MVNELKSWCLSKLQNMEVRFIGDPSTTKLQRSSSVAENLNEVDGAGLTVLPSGQADGSKCLELHTSPALLDSTRGQPTVAEGDTANHYFVVHVESSPGKTSTNSLPNSHKFTAPTCFHIILTAEIIDPENDCLCCYKIVSSPKPLRNDPQKCVNWLKIFKPEY